MKSENSRLLLGLGIGALVGVAVGYLMTQEHRQKLKEHLQGVGHGIKDGAQSVFSKVKSSAERTGSKFAEKTGEWVDDAGEKAKTVADDLSQKADDFRQYMDERAAFDEQQHAQHAENFRKDIGNQRDRKKQADK